jgi:iduronate 2-sulfatase
MNHTLRHTTRLLLICAAAMAFASAARAEHYDVFIISGQSNCDGRGSAAALTGPLAKWAGPRKDVVIEYSCSTLRGPALGSDGFKPLQPGWSVAPGKNRPRTLPSGTFGPEVSFGAAMAKAMPGKHIALIKFAEGGTSLKKDWNPDIRGRLYDAGVAFVTKSLKDLQDKGDTCEIRGMIWHQGESDAGLPAEEYQTLLTTFITRVRTDVGAADMPFGIGDLYDDGERDKVRAALKATASAVRHAFFVSAEGLKTSDKGTHFDAAGQIELGERYAAGMMKALGGKMTDDERLTWFEAQAEQAYDQLCDARPGTDAAARYSDAKEALHDAIALAGRLGRNEDAERLNARLSHIKAVFRSQFG